MRIKIFFFVLEREQSARFVFEYKASNVMPPRTMIQSAAFTVRYITANVVTLGRRLITVALCQNVRENKRYRCTINSFLSTFTLYFCPLFSFEVSFFFHTLLTLN